MKRIIVFVIFLWLITGCSTWDGSFGSSYSDRLIEDLNKTTQKLRELSQEKDLFVKTWNDFEKRKVDFATLLTDQELKAYEKYFFYEETGNYAVDARNKIEATKGLKELLNMISPEKKQRVIELYAQTGVLSEWAEDIIAREKKLMVEHGANILAAQAELARLQAGSYYNPQIYQNPYEWHQTTKGQWYYGSSLDEWNTQQDLTGLQNSLVGIQSELQDLNFREQMWDFRRMLDENARRSGQPSLFGY